MKTYRRLTDSYPQKYPDRQDRKFRLAQRPISYPSFTHPVEAQGRYVPRRQALEAQGMNSGLDNRKTTNYPEDGSRLKNCEVLYVP